MLVVHAKGERGHAIGGKNFFRGVWGGSGTKVSDGGRRGRRSRVRSAPGGVARRGGKRRKKRGEARRAIQRGLLHLEEKGELSEGFGREDRSN